MSLIFLCNQFSVTLEISMMIFFKTIFVTRKAERYPTSNTDPCCSTSFAMCKFAINTIGITTTLNHVMLCCCVPWRSAPRSRTHCCVQCSNTEFSNKFLSKLLQINFFICNCFIQNEGIYGCQIYKVKKQSFPILFCLTQDLIVFQHLI